VDRLQAILDEFLNFSRPLVPLALGVSDVGANRREVAMLHEAWRATAAWVVEVHGRRQARCDPRKVKQVSSTWSRTRLDAAPPATS